MAKKYLVVSVHDGTPRFKSELNEIVLELDRIGIKKKSILVIPNYLGKESILYDKDFTDWLYELNNQGNEIVQHGYNHISTNHNYKSFLTKFIGIKIAHGCGEFQNISYEEAGSKIQQGKEIFHNIKLDPIGFIAPAWLLNQKSEQAIRENFSYTTKFRSIEFYLQNKTEPSNVIVFISGKGWVNKVFSLHNNFLLNKKFKKQKIAQVAVHPQDLESGFFSSILNAINQLKQDREIVTYADLT